MSHPFQLDIGPVDFVGSNFMRPECVLATRSEHLYASDRLLICSPHLRPRSHVAGECHGRAGRTDGAQR